MTQVKCVSSHAEDLADGRTLAPGDVASADLAEPHNNALLEDGKLLALGDPPTKADLLAKAEELKDFIDVPYKGLKVEELQQVIADAEAAKAAKEAEEAAKGEENGDVS